MEGCDSLPGACTYVGDAEIRNVGGYAGMEEIASMLCDEPVVVV